MGEDRGDGSSAAPPPFGAAPPNSSASSPPQPLSSVAFPGKLKAHDGAVVVRRIVVGEVAGSTPLHAETHLLLLTVFIQFKNWGIPLQLLSSPGCVGGETDTEKKIRQWTEEEYFWNREYK